MSVPSHDRSGPCDTEPIVLAILRQFHHSFTSVFITEITISFIFLDGTPYALPQMQLFVKKMAAGLLSYLFGIK